MRRASTNRRRYTGACTPAVVTTVGEEITSMATVRINRSSAVIKDHRISVDS
jgi:hypothetical protein